MRSILVPVKQVNNGAAQIAKGDFDVRIEKARNDELGQLDRALEEAFSLLAVGGRFSVITFHSLEDRMVKKRFAEFTAGCTCPPDFPQCVCGKKPRGKLVFRKPVTADEKELEENPRSRSAKLRTIEKLRDTVYDK